MLINSIFFFISVYLALVSLTFYFYHLGRIITKIASLEKTNISANIILGLGIFISAINLIYFFGLRDFKIILCLIFVHILIFFFFHCKNYKKFFFDYKLLFLFIISIVVSLSCFEHRFLNFDDFYGYSNLYLSIINNNYNFSPDLQFRAYYVSFGYNFIESIFIFLNNISTIHFFDQAFGTSLIIIYFYENFYLNNKSKIKKEFLFFIFFIVISTISIPETSQPKIILYALSIIILSELKKFSDGSTNISVLISLLFIGYNLKYSYIISFIYIVFFIFLFFRILTKEIKLEENIKKIVYLFCIFLLPDLINKFYIFDSLSPVLFNSKYAVAENFFFKEIKFIRNFDTKTYFIFWSLVLIKKHFLIIFGLFVILFFNKKKLYFNSIIFLSYCFSIFIISFLLFPDKFNSQRYLWPLENALIIFFVMQIINDKFLITFIKNYKYLFKFCFALICIYMSLLTPKPLSFYELYKNKFENISNIFLSSNNLNKNFFFKNKLPDKKTIVEYQMEFNACFNNFEKDIEVLSILNYSFLIQKKKLKQLEINTGFAVSKNLFPFFQSFNDKNIFLKKNYQGIIIEKKLIYENLILESDLGEFHNRLKGKKIDLTDFYSNYSKYDMTNLVIWLDFVGTLKNPKFLRKINCETDNFISFKF